MDGLGYRIIISSGSGLMKRAMEKRKSWRSRRCRLRELPWDVWVNILSRLPTKSILRGRSVCKAWRDLLAHPHFTQVHSQRSEQYPALLYFAYNSNTIYHIEIIGDGNNGGRDTRTPTTSSTRTAAAAVMALECYSGMYPAATCNGIVCFLDWPGRGRCHVGNPLVDRVKDFVHVAEPSRGHCLDEFGGFGFSLKTKRYKVVRFYFLSDEPGDGARQIHVEICTVGDGGSEGEHTWRDLGPFRHAVRRPGDDGWYLDGGIHWLVCDRHPAFISRLDLDSEQFERLPAPESEDFQLPHIQTCERNKSRTLARKAPSLMMGMRMGVSGGHLIICANLSCRKDDTMSIWVRMEESWMKKFVVKRPRLVRKSSEDVKVLNYGRLVEEDAAGWREGAEVVLFYSRSRNQRLFASSTDGQHVRQISVDQNFSPATDSCCGDLFAFPHVPSLISIRDACG